MGNQTKYSKEIPLQEQSNCKTSNNNSGLNKDDPTEIAVQTESSKSSEVGIQYELTMISSGVQTDHKKFVNDGCQTETAQYRVFCQTTTMCIAQITCQTELVQRKIYRDQNDQTDDALPRKITATAQNAVLEMGNQVLTLVSTEQPGFD